MSQTGGYVSGPAPNLFGLHEFDNQSSFYGTGSGAGTIPKGAGWALILGFGAFFAVLAWILQWIDVKFSSGKYNNEQFNTAGRTIGAGLIAVDVVSHWTWASIILSTGTYAWFYGAGSCFWYGTGSGTVTVWMFCVVAIELKHKAPKAHTYLEIVKCRWGTQAHLVYIFLGLFINFFSLGMMEAAVYTISAVSGINVYGASFAVPYCVAAYALVGGLKATFTTSYLHTVLIYVVCLIFMFLTYCTSSKLGSIDKVYDRLVIMGQNYPVINSRSGSYLTAWSDGALQINAINAISALAVLFCDQSYWQSAVAASPEGAVKGYAIGSYLYLGIVFSLPMGIALGGLALDLPLSLDEVYNDLVLPASAGVIMGKGGVVLIVSVILMAITSGGAGEQLAVSSIFTFDIYREYIRPKASGKELVLVSRCTVFAWATIMGIAMLVFNEAGVNVYWMGIWTSAVVSGGVAPVVYLLTWDECTMIAAIYGGAVFGGVGGMITWLMYPLAKNGVISIQTTEYNMPVLISAVVGLGIGIIVPPIITWLTPKAKRAKFDWKRFDNIEFSDETAKELTMIEKRFITRWRWPIWISTIVVIILTEFVWPLLSLPAGGVWSRAYFRFNVVLGFIIILTSSLIAIFLPLWEGRHGFIDLYNWARGRHDQDFVPRMQRGDAVMDDSAHGGDLDPEALKLGPKISITPGGSHPHIGLVGSNVPHPKLSADQQLKAEQEHAEIELRAKLHGGRI